MISSSMGSLYFVKGYKPTYRSYIGLVITTLDFLFNIMFASKSEKNYSNSNKIFYFCMMIDKKKGKKEPISSFIDYKKEKNSTHKIFYGNEKEVFFNGNKESSD